MNDTTALSCPPILRLNSVHVTHTAYSICPQSLGICGCFEIQLEPPQSWTSHRDLFSFITTTNLQHTVKMARRPARCYRYCKNKVRHHRDRKMAMERDGEKSIG